MIFVAGFISGIGVVMLWLIAESCREAVNMKNRQRSDKEADIAS